MAVLIIEASHALAEKLEEKEAEAFIHRDEEPGCLATGAELQQGELICSHLIDRGGISSWSITEWVHQSEEYTVWAQRRLRLSAEYKQTH